MHKEFIKWFVCAFFESLALEAAVTVPAGLFGFPSLVMCSIAVMTRTSGLSASRVVQAGMAPAGDSQEVIGCEGVIFRNPLSRP